MQTKNFFSMRNCKALTLLLFTLSFLGVVNCSALAKTSSVEILYRFCGSEEQTSISVSMPESAVFPENNFLTDTVFLRYEKVGNKWTLNHELSDIDKKYTRQAVLLIKENVLKHRLGFECLDVSAKFSFGDEQQN